MWKKEGSCLSTKNYNFVFLKLQPFLDSLIFLAGLELIAIKHDFVLQIALVLLIMAIFQGRGIGKKWNFSVLPAFFTISSVSLLYLIAPGYQQQIFIILASSMYYMALFGAYRLGQYEDDKTAKGMNMAATVSTIFFTFASFYGIYLNFLVPLYVLMLAYLAVTLLVSYQQLSLIKKGNESLVWIYSFLLALAMVELIWTMNFWPFGYLTTGVIALILYYVLWDMIYSYLTDFLSKKRVVANAVLFSFLIALILLSSKWIPVI
jgi:hypothetical protein